MNVLKPFANDFLLSPTIIEVDKIPNETSPNNIKSPKIVNAMPEFEDVRKVATANGVSIEVVNRAVIVEIERESAATA